MKMNKFLPLSSLISGFALGNTKLVVSPHKNSPYFMVSVWESSSSLHQLSQSHSPRPFCSLSFVPSAKIAPFYCRCWTASVTSDFTTCKTRALPGSCRPTPWIICDRLICLGAKPDLCCCFAQRPTSSCGTSTSKKANTLRRPLAGLNATSRRS